MILTITLNAAIDKRYVLHGLRLGEMNRMDSCVYSAGGKGINVARVVSIAGEKTLASGFVGGHAGDFITDQLPAFGIKNAFYRLEQESRSNVNIWDADRKIQTEILEPGPTVSQKEYCDFQEKYKQLLADVEVVALSGSVPKGLGPDAYVPFISIAKAAGKKVILDTSGDFLKEGIKAKPTLVKPNIDEIRMLTGKNCDTREEILEAAQQIHREGVEIVVISLGSEGSYVVCEQGVFRALVPKIDAVNTVGCGDSMIAGFALGMKEKLSMEDMLRKASAISAAAALREETGFFVVEDMERLMSQIEISKL